MIVAIHSKCIFMLSSGEPHYYLSYNVQRFITVLSDCAVPCFFALSVYLLFRKYEISDYFKIIKKKLISLVIPYFIWSIVGFLFFNIIFHLILGYEIVFSLEENLLDILLAKKNSPIWFLRSLFAMVVVSPLFYLSYKYLKHFSLIIFVALIILNLFVQFSYSGVVFWIPMYFIGGYLGYFGIDINALKKKSYISIISLLAYISYAVCIVVFEVEEQSVLYYLYRLSSALMIWLAFDILKVIYEYDAKNWMKVSSFVFFSHVIVVTLVRGIVFRILGESNLMILIGYFIIIFTTFCFVVGFANLLRKICPPVYKILSGGR